jgi:hypothetical protein
LSGQSTVATGSSLLFAQSWHNIWPGVFRKNPASIGGEAELITGSVVTRSSAFSKILEVAFQGNFAPAFGHA